jgi:hypothetical protein
MQKNGTDKIEQSQCGEQWEVVTDSAMLMEIMELCEAVESDWQEDREKLKDCLRS